MLGLCIFSLSSLVERGHDVCRKLEGFKSVKILRRVSSQVSRHQARLFHLIKQLKFVTLLKEFVFKLNQVRVLCFCILMIVVCTRLNQTASIWSETDLDLFCVTNQLSLGRPLVQNGYHTFVVLGDVARPRQQLALIQL